jgi:ABC-type hemin transport system ATPase subunit
MVVLETRDVSYRRCGSTALRRVSVAVVRGELLAVCGPPGAGTSALLRVLGGASPPDAGRVVRHAGRARFTRGSDAAAAALDAAEPGSVLLLDHPAEPDADEDSVLGRARWAAERGAAVVVSTHDLGLAARHAHTAALLVAGRLVAWAEPAVAFVPAVRLLGYAGSFPAETVTGWEARTTVERTHLRVAG